MPLQLAEEPKLSPEKAADPLSIFDAFWKEVRRLPFAEHIPKKVAQEWHKNAMRSSKTVTWHLRRLGDAHGALVGGSEIGALVCDYLKERHPFGTTPVDIFNSKLMRDPLFENPAMRFGTKYERTCLDALELEHPDWTVDLEALEAFSQARKDGVFGDGLGGMAYSPDNIYRTADGRRILVDAKVPFSREIPDGPPLNYVSQLHQGHLVAAHLKFPIDEMVLAFYRVPKDETQAAQLVTFEGMKADPMLLEIIPRLVGQFRAQVATGKPPMPLDESAIQEMQDIERRLLDLRVQRALLERQEQQLLLDLSERVKTLTPPQINVLPLQSNTRSTYALDESAKPELLRVAADIGVDMQAYTKPTGVMPLDEDRVVQALKDLGQDDQAIDALREPSPPARIDISSLIGENPALSAFVARKTSFNTPKAVLDDAVAQRIRETNEAMDFHDALQTPAEAAPHREDAPLQVA